MLIFVDYFAVHIDYTLRSRSQEGAIDTVPEGTRQMSRDILQLEWRRTGGLRGAAAIANVPLPARPHQCLSQADASARFHFIVTEEGLGSCRRQHPLLSRCWFALLCRACLKGVESRDFRGNAVEEADRAKGQKRLVVARAGRAKEMDKVPVRSEAWRISQPLVLSTIVSRHHEGEFA